MAPVDAAPRNLDVCSCARRTIPSGSFTADAAGTAIVEQGLCTLGRRASRNFTMLTIRTPAILLRLLRLAPLRDNEQASRCAEVRKRCPTFSHQMCWQSTRCPGMLMFPTVGV